ncbi:MAG TPA: S8 family serine peptidase [Steroidobacteraceae bacterium]|nr:S8 family serine peptidase [Steroidobacteraceae bacterium]
MKRWAPLCFALPVCLALLASACGNSPVRIDSRALTDQISRSPDHFIIAAVENDPIFFVARAGGTPRGYDSIAAYGPSPAARQVMRSLENEYGLREVSAWPIEPLHMHCAVLEVPEGTDRGTLLAALAHDRRVKLAQPLQSFATRTEDYNDPYVELQRGFRQMDVAAAHPWSRGEGVKVAIIDTGVDTRHPDLRANIAAAANFVDSDDQQFQRDRHGTEVAGVIAAVANNHEGIVGIAPAARLLLFKACWQMRFDADAARCNSFTLARALVAAFDAHAQIVNMSLGGPADPLLNDLIREGLRRGVLFVGAAPADLSGAEGLLHQPGVIEVASAGNQPALESVLYAPGREILTLLPGGHYDFASGDSIATAQVSGVVALLLAKNPALSAADAYRLLRDTSTHPSAPGGDGALVDACAAVVQLVGRGSCSTTSDADHRAAGQTEQRLALH